MPVKAVTKKSEARDLKKQKEAAAFANILWVFGAVVVLETFLIAGYEQCLRNDYYAVWYQYVLYYGRYVFALLAGASAAAAIAIGRRRGRAAALVRVAVLCAVFWGVFSIVWAGALATAKSLCVAVPVAGLLLFILFTYQREFFFECLLGVMTITAMLAVRGKIDIVRGGLGVGLAVIVLSLFLAALAYAASKNRGRIGFLGRKLAVFDEKNAAYAPLYLACPLSRLQTAGALVFGADFAYAAICLKAAFLFVAAVYHTVKMM